MNRHAIVLSKRVESRILFLRGQRVLLDVDLAELYGVEVRQLNQQVKRNAKRFPPAFRFQVADKELEILRSQNVISRRQHGGNRYRPYAFSEHGAIMAATVLNSERAIEMSIFVVMAFVRMREILSENREIAKKLAEIEQKLKNHDGDIVCLFSTVKRLLEPVRTRRRRIGFQLPEASRTKYARAV